MKALPHSTWLGPCRSFLCFSWAAALLLATTSTNATEITFAAEPFPPFVTEQKADHKAGGPLVEIIQLTCERIQVTCTVSILPWRRALAMAEAGTVDGLFPLARNPARESTFYFSEPFVETASSFFALDASSFKYVEPKSLDGYTVGVYGPSAGSALVEEAVKAGSAGRVEIEVNNVTVLRKLVAGRYGAADQGVINMNRDVGKYLLKTEGIVGIRLAGDLRKVQLHIGFGRKNAKEAQFQDFNRALKAVIREGKVKSILDRYDMKLPG